MKTQELTEMIFQRGKEEGFGEMELHYESNKKFSCNIFKGEVDDYSIAIDGGLAFRGIYKDKMGYSYTEKLDESSVDTLIAGAKTNAQMIDSNEVEEIFEGSTIYEKIDFYSDDLSRVTAEEKMELLLKLEKEIYGLDKRVKSVDYCLLEDYESEVMLFNTKGLAKAEKSNNMILYVSVVVEANKDVKSSYEILINRDFKKFNYEEIARSVVNEALSHLGAESIASGKYQVLFKNKAAAMLIQAFAGVFSADNVHKGKSLLKNKLGEAIASPLVRIVDNPHLKDGVRSSSFDSEGVATKKNVIVEDGLLKSLLHNLKTAKKDGVTPTGNGYKSSYKGTISVTPTNFYVKAGANTYEDMIKAMEEGIIITDLQGLHSGTNPVSGDFSLAANGYYVKDGAIKRPLNQITVAGNFYDVLKDITAIGDDLRFTYPSSSYTGSPSLKVGSLAISGETKNSKESK